MSFRDYMESRKSIINNALKQLLPPSSQEPDRIHESMEYSLFAGGKRLRPMLTLMTAESLGTDIQDVLEPACALEFIHTYSLMHDDLPVMDNDDYRRGKLTNHKVFGEDIAILGGIQLLVNAYLLVVSWANARSHGGSRMLHIIRSMAHASGLPGMVGGQVLDLESEGKSLKLDEIRTIHSLKTGAMIECSVMLGAIASSASEDNMEALARYAKSIGIAFQIVDDILDIEGDLASLGKMPGSDVSNIKSTYPSLVGLETAKIMAQEEIDAAKTALKNFSGNSEHLMELADYLAKRKN